MKYKSTRSDETVSPSYALLHGLAGDGGLYVPVRFPENVLTYDDIKEKTYKQIACLVLSYFFTNFSAADLEAMADRAYNRETFRAETVVPLRSLDTDVSIAELFHGRTSAFKDLALSIFPHLLTAAKKEETECGEILILTATSGDTGKAAMEGFKDIAGTHITVFYPSDGVSSMQKMQMQKQEGGNVDVKAIYGNFDDAQSFLKRVFTDKEVNAYAQKKGVMFSSANSINIGRLLPQIVYYVSIYAALVENGSIGVGEPFDIVVPTGNFGNILAAYLAGKMGIPLGQLICASNKNKVLADFFASGTYDMNRPFYTTNSPSMDILLASNFERFLYYLTGGDTDKVAAWEKELAETGRLTAGEAERAALTEHFAGDWIDDEETKFVINHTFNDNMYLFDPHSAVAYGVYLKRKRAGLMSGRHTVIMATAHPYKFPSVICEALGLPADEDPFDALERLYAVSAMNIPKPLKRLQKLPLRFTETINKDAMKTAVMETIDRIGAHTERRRGLE